MGQVQQELDLDMQVVEKMDAEIVSRLNLTIDDSVQWAETWITSVTEIDTHVAKLFEIIQESVKEIVGFSDTPHSQNDMNNLRQVAGRLDQAEKECHEHFDAKVMEAYMSMQYQDIIKQSLERAAEALMKRCKLINTQADGMSQETMGSVLQSEMGHILADYIESDSKHR